MSPVVDHTLTVFSEVEGALVAALRSDITCGYLRHVQASMDDRLVRPGIHTIIFDFAAVGLIGGEEMTALAGNLKVLRLLGSRIVICGLQPTVVSALVELGFFFEDVEVATSLSDALSVCGHRA